jgi:STE24 endopeptidase
MNIYGLGILSALLVVFVSQTAALLLNLRTLRMTIPAELEGVYEAERYRIHRDYVRAKIKLTVLNNASNLLVLLAFWFAGGFNMLDQAARAWAQPWHLGVTGTGIIYTAMLIGLRISLDIPSHAYEGLVIQPKFGLNSVTLKTLALEVIEDLLFWITLTSIMLILFSFLLNHGGSYIWVICWLTISAFLIGLNWIAPTFIKCEPLEEGELKDMVSDYVKTVRFPLDKIKVMDVSRCPKILKGFLSKSKVFVMGVGSSSHVVLADTVVAQYEPDEIKATIAHEIGHYVKKHVRQQLTLKIMYIGILCWSLPVFAQQKQVFEAFYIEQASAYAGLVFYMVSFRPIWFFWTIAVSASSRRCEYAADRFAITTIGDGEFLVRVLKRFQSDADQMVDLTPHWFLVFLKYRDPPILARIKEIRAQSPKSISGSWKRA